MTTNEPNTEFIDYNFKMAVKKKAEEYTNITHSIYSLD